MKSVSKDRKDKLVRASIMGQEYTIRSDEEEKVLQVASYLSEQMVILKKGSPVLNRFDLAVMTAFKAASDYFSALEELEGLKRQVESKAGDLSARIDANLGK